MIVARLVAVTAVLGLLLAGCVDPHTWPEDQDDIVNGPLEVRTHWQAFTLEQPLQINDEGRQRLHLVLDGEQYESNDLHDPKDYVNQFNPRRVDGVLIEPDIILVGDNGNEVRVHGTGSLGVRTGRLILAFGTHHGDFEDFLSRPPAIPDDIEHFEALRIRSNEPFTIEALHWSVDRHPDLHRCGRRCTWLERWLMGE